MHGARIVTRPDKNAKRINTSITHSVSLFELCLQEKWVYNERMKKSELQESDVFFTDLKASIRKAKKRIWIQVMIFEMVEEIEEYVSLFTDAVERGVDVRVIFDWISERYYTENLDIYPTINPDKIKKRKEVDQFAHYICQKMRSAGITVTVTNTPSALGKLLLLGKRNHNKLFIIDGTAWMGGINLITSSSRYVDFMVKLYDSSLVSVVADYFLHKRKENAIIPANPEYKFLIDGGKKGQSLIYEKAVELVKHAEKEIIFVSQMLPDNSFLTELLKKARQGIYIRVVISTAEHNIFTKFPFRYHYSLFKFHASQNSNITLLHSRQRIHAKLLLVDNTAIFGSHNFAKWNEFIGIEETGFLTNDENVLQQCRNFASNIKT